MKITILGAGTAGLVSAIILKKTFPKYDVKVIESDSIGIIGVGEGSTEHWKQFVDYCDINIHRLVRETDAALKRGIRFENWNGDGKSYYHALGEPFFSDVGENMVSDSVFSRCLIAQGIKSHDVLMDTNLINYHAGLHSVNQYHFNTFKLNQFLHKVAKERDIQFVNTTIKDVKFKENGDVEGLIDEQDAFHTADLFIDSSGMKRVISSKMGVQWIPYSKYLPMNHALAFPTTDVSDLKPYTLSRALSSGWNWRISTQERYGNGYVFCDEFIDSTKAYDEIQSVYDEKVEVAKDIKFVAGRVDKFWVNNCVNIGLSSAFVEPLEASSIGHSILQSFAMCHIIPKWKLDRKCTEIFNRKMISSFDNIVDFIQLHYITKRNDSQFWKELPNLMTKTDFVQEHLETYKKVLPRRTDFFGEYHMFSAPNWAQVMDGLELFDRNHFKQELISNYGEGIIDQQVRKYQEYLGKIETAVYIDHKVLLEQNKTYIKFNKT